MSIPNEFEDIVAKLYESVFKNMMNELFVFGEENGYVHPAFLFTSLIVMTLSSLEEVKEIDKEKADFCLNMIHTIVGKMIEETQQKNLH